MKQFEHEFEAHLDALDKDARAGCVFVYTELILHFHFGSDFDVRDRVNPHAGFWNGVLGSLQSSGFIALGRMYDLDGRAHTIGALLDFAESHTGIFQPSALHDRVIAHGLTPADAKTFVATAHRLQKGGLSHLRREFETHRSVYSRDVEPVRHKVFAHAGRLDVAARDALFTRVFLRDFERLAVFPLRLYRALFGLYRNGMPPMLDSPPTIVTDVLKSIPNDSTTTWEHLHVAKHVEEFVAWMKTAPVPPDKGMKELTAAISRAIQKDDQP